MSTEPKKRVRTPKAVTKTTAKRQTSVPAAVAGVIAVPAQAAAVIAAPTEKTTTAQAVAAAISSGVPAVAETPAVAVKIAPAESVVPSPAPAGPAVAYLIGDLLSADADTAREAAAALGVTGDAGAVVALIDVLENHDGYFHSVVRSAAASSLAMLGDRRAVGALLHAVNDTMAEASAEAIRALAELGDPRAVETLIGVVGNESGYFAPVARLAAVKALRRFGAAETLARVAADLDEAPVIREAAGASLG